MKSRLFLAILVFWLISVHMASGAGIFGNWALVNPDAAFSPRAWQGTAVFDDRVWIIGGTSFPPFTPEKNASFSDVWSSADGKTWSLETGHAGFSPRFGHGVVVFDRRIWVIGGYTEAGYDNGVWSSSDGKNWTLETAHAGFSPRVFQGAGVFDGRIWVVGGETLKGNVNDVWSSADGKNWTREKDHAEFLPRYGQGVVAYHGHLWVIGGYSMTETSRGYTIMRWLNDVWSSADGRSWRLENSSPAFESREFVPLAVFNESLWIAGGGGPPSFKSVKIQVPYSFDSVWSSADGINWTLDTEHAGFSPRYGHGVAAFRDGLWVIGGSLKNGTPMNDVWRYGPEYEPPEAAFISNATRGTVPLGVEFVDASCGEIKEWRWDFGDGGYASGQNPVHVFVNPGSYTVHLEVSGPGGVNGTSAVIEADIPPTSPAGSGPDTFVSCSGMLIAALGAVIFLKRRR